MIVKTRLNNVGPIDWPADVLGGIAGIPRGPLPEFGVMELNDPNLQVAA